MALHELNSLFGYLMAHLDFMRDKEYLPVEASDLGTRFRNIRHNYRLHQQLVDRGLASWMSDDPYKVGNWIALFTPIEAAAWGDIRERGLVLWPQFPVDRFFVDFGNPVVKIALECDGARWHNQKKDAARDSILESLGWIVFRAPGWRCVKVVDRPDDFPLLSDEERNAYFERKRRETLSGVLDEIERLWRFPTPTPEVIR